MEKILSKASWCFILLFSLFVSCKTSKPVKHAHHKEIAVDNSFYTSYSEKLGVKLTGTEDKALIKCLAGWLGTPYKYGGISKQGTDCSGMVFSVYKEVYGIGLYRSSYDQVKNVTQINKKELSAGDLVFFITAGNSVSHVGIYIGDHKFIHASTKRGVVINSLEEDYYIKHFFSCGKVVMKHEK